MSGDPRVPALVEALSSATPYDGREREAIERLLTLLAGADPYDRGNVTPGHVTASAFVVHPSGESVALLLHSKLGRWLQPGGHVEPDDPTVEAAALREVLEEIGVEPVDPPELFDVDIHSYPERGSEPGHLHFDVRVTFRAAGDELVIGDGADDVRWWPLEECLGMGASISRPARKLLGRSGASL